MTIRHIFKPQKLRTLEEIQEEITTLEKESEGLLQTIIEGGN